MRKGEATKIFLDRVAPTLQKYGYERNGKSFRRVFHEPGIIVRILPEFATHTGEMVFDNFIEISMQEYAEEKMRFMNSVYPEYVSRKQCMIMLMVNDIEDYDRDYDNDLSGFIIFFIRSVAKVNNYIEENFSSKRRFLSYFWKNTKRGGVNRTLAVFILMRSCEGIEAASKWLRSGVPDTPSEYQQRQLEYLLQRFS